MRSRACIVSWAFLGVVTVSHAQPSPGTSTFVDWSGPELVTLSVSEQAIVEVGRYPIDTTSYYPGPGLRVHPATGDVIVLAGGVRDIFVSRYRRRGNVYRAEALFALGSTTIIQRGNPVSMSFDDEGVLHYKAGGPYVAIDLDRQTWNVMPQTQPGTIIATVPAKAGRPRVDMTAYPTSPSSHCLTLAVIDPYGGVRQILDQRCGGIFEVFYMQQIETLSSGRTFAHGGFESIPGELGCPCVREVDWRTGRLTTLDLGPGFLASGYVVAEGLGRIYAAGARRLGATLFEYGVASYDLGTGQAAVSFPPPAS